jgi:hypothetical protein
LSFAMGWNFFLTMGAIWYSMSYASS